MGLSLKHATTSSNAKRRLPVSSKWIAYLSFLSLLTIIGILFQNEIIGQIAVVLFGVLSLVFRIKSDESFKLALASFVVVAIAAVAHLEDLSRYFATYAFLLLCVGVVGAIKEHLSGSNDVLFKSYVSGVYSRNYAAMKRVKREFVSRRSRKIQ